MPQRLLRPGIRQSKRWNRLPYFEQVFYIRLLTLVDDYGRYEADPELLRSEAFPFGDPEGNVIQMTAIDSALLSFDSKNMLDLYEKDGTKYLQMTRWRERARTESKFPDPKTADKIPICQTNDSKCQQMIASPPSPSPSPVPSPAGRHLTDKNSVNAVSGLLNNLGTAIFRQPPNHWPSEASQRAAVQVVKRPDWKAESETVLAFHRSIQPHDRRFQMPSNLTKLLEEWAETLDKARTYSPSPINGNRVYHDPPEGG